MVHRRRKESPEMPNNLCLFRPYPAVPTFNNRATPSASHPLSRKRRLRAGKLNENNSREKRGKWRSLRLSGVTAERGADLRKGFIQRPRQSQHSSNSPERDQSDNQSVFDQFLAFFAGCQNLELHVQLEK